MNHPSKNSGFERMLVVLGLLSGFGAAAHAQATSDVTPPSPAQSLSCLVRQEKPPVYPSRLEKNRVGGFMRVQLHFNQADAPPRVEVLANTAAPEMQEQVFRFLEGYRLPCLTSAEGPVRAVQEFSFTNSEREPLPVERENKGELCVVMPREPMEPPTPWPGDREVEHVVAVLTFSGDGQQAPAVKIIHSTGSNRLESAVREQVAKYRMPCRTGAEQPMVVQQMFSFNPAGARRYVLKREIFRLAEFLGMTAGIQAVQADFDFSTMNCPFKVDYSILGPNLPNEVRAGKPDPNRAVFLKWLAERQLAFANAKQANELFGEVIQIQVPCGTLKLQGEESASRTDAS